jgi:hypothetical protein
MNIDTDDTKRLVQKYGLESENYLRQIQIWLGTASAGGAIAMATLAAGLPNPAYAFEYLILSFWFFLAGIVSAGIATFALAMRASAKGVHFASAHNSGSANAALRTRPTIIAAPKRADPERDYLMQVSTVEHDRAEEAWTIQKRWKILWISAVIVSCLAFIGGFSWPLIQMSFLGKQIVPV